MVMTFIDRAFADASAALAFTGAAIAGADSKLAALASSSLLRRSPSFRRRSHHVLREDGQQLRDFLIVRGETEGEKNRNANNNVASTPPSFSLSSPKSFRRKHTKAKEKSRKKIHRTAPPSVYTPLSFFLSPLPLPLSFLQKTSS